MRKNYRVIFIQYFNGEFLQDSFMKYEQTVIEMERVIDALYSDPHVKSARYTEVTV